jgi:DNA-binding LacI/PurR family transcriptional regulator
MSGNKHANMTGPEGPVSMVELAAMLGLSHATVSFVLNGHATKHKISTATQQRVLEAAERYHCIPNQQARNLRMRRSGMIGVVLPTLTMDWAAALMQGLNKVLDATDYVPFVTAHEFDAGRNRKELQSALQRRDDGLIAFPLPDCADLYHSVQRAGVRLVLLGEEMPGMEDISTVLWDSEAAAEQVMRHLVESGRRKIAFLGMDYPGLGTLHRLKAYGTVLKECGLELRKEWIARLKVPLPPGEMERVLRQWFPESNRTDSPDAIFALNDAMALPAMQYLLEWGIAVPGEVAVAGIQDLPLSRHPAISLTTVPEPVEAMGEQAARLMLELISGKSKPPLRRVIPAPPLIVRRSTAR